MSQKLIQTQVAEAAAGAASIAAADATSTPARNAAY